MGGATNGVGGEGDRFVMTFSDVFLPVPFLASPFDLHRVFGPRHLRYVPPAPFWQLSVISLKGKRRRPDQPQSLWPPKVILESTFCGTFPPPPPANSRDTFCPPPPLSRCPAILAKERFTLNSLGWPPKIWVVDSKSVSPLS